MIDIILCCGAHGRAVVFGSVEKEPVPGEPVRLYDARMILYWAGSGGLFGVAATGPDDGSRLTAPVPVVVETCWQEWLAVSDGAAAKIRAWPDE